MEVQRTTSAGYRLPVKSNPSIRQQTNRNVGTNRLDIGKLNNDRLTHKIGGSQCDAVSYEKILTGRIKQEWFAVKKWNTNWSLIIEECYQSKGSGKSPQQEPPEYEESYLNDSKIPVTEGGVYGRGHGAESARNIIQYQHDMSRSVRKRDPGPEFQSL